MGKEAHEVEPEMWFMVKRRLCCRLLYYTVIAWFAASGFWTNQMMSIEPDFVGAKLSFWSGST
jgi:hypothetical protein